MVLREYYKFKNLIDSTIKNRLIQVERKPGVIPPVFGHFCAVSTRG